MSKSTSLTSQFLQSYINQLVAGIQETPIEEKVFKLTMEIVNAHEKLRYGIVDSTNHVLLQYHRSISSLEDNSNLPHDIVFYDAYNIPQVYSVYFNKTFPLLEYPFHLYAEHHVWVTKPEYHDLHEYYKTLNYDVNDTKYKYLNMFLGRQ